MADDPIGYEEAKAARDDTVIMATGRSDYPNQVNNVLGFPFIFRGALDVRATEINEEMKVACAEALADLAKQDVPDAVIKAYGDQPLRFGPEYILPKPIDPRVLFEIAPAVARAAIESGAARTEVDADEYRERLEARLGKSREMMRVVLNKAKSDPKRVLLSEGEDKKTIRPPTNSRRRGSRRRYCSETGSRFRRRCPDSDSSSAPRSSIPPSATTRPTPITSTRAGSARGRPAARPTTSSGAIRTTSAA